MSTSDSNEAGPSRTHDPSGHSESPMTTRQKEKAPVRRVGLGDIRLDEAGLEQEIDLLIGQYLDSRGVPAISRIWEEQVLGRGGQGASRKEQIDNVERAILDGEFSSLEGLVAQPGLLRPQTQKAFLYLCYRQQFLEHVENRESQKAFNLLQKRLKPLEHYQPVPYDFYSLSYLTSASTVHDAPTFRDWAGVGPERDRLIAMWRELMDSERTEGGRKTFVPPDRLRTLLRQAAAWQVSQLVSSGPKPTRVPTLLQDYRPLVLPDGLVLIVKGHTANVKAVDFIGPDGHFSVSGASDSTLRIFSTEDGTTQRILTGHTSRIWDCAASSPGAEIASASGDGTVRVWSTQGGTCRRTLQGDGGDVYSVRWRPGHEAQLASASYDKIIRSWDVETGKQLRTFSGHSQSTLTVAFDNTGNIIASGSKDKHIRLWDAVGGVCIQTFTGCLGEITSVEFDQEGRYILAGCKDNSNRLWDLRMQRNIYRYTGHQNTSKNLIRCGFAHSASLVIGGSEDGSVYIWEREGVVDTLSGAAKSTAPGLLSSNMAAASADADARASPAYYPPRQTRTVHSSQNILGGTAVRPFKVLEGHGEGAVFDVKWHDGKLLSAGEDGTVGVWGASET